MADPTPSSTTSENASRTSATATSTCTTGVPDEFGHVPSGSCNSKYGFYPSWQWNLGFAVLFAVTTSIHLVQAWRFKKKFCWVIVMGALWLAICFVLRTLGARDQQQFAYVIVSTLLFLLAPIWINAFAYMVVARLVYFLLPEQRVILSARWIAKVFVAADITAFIVQAIGGSLLADNAEDISKLGQKIYMGGIAIQLIFVLLFAVIAVKFQRRLSLLIKCGKLERSGLWVKPVLWTLFAVLGLIVIRIVFRLVEFGGGASGENELLQHEEYQLFLDALPMLAATGLLIAVHPARVLRGPGSEFPKRPWSWCGLRKDSRAIPEHPIPLTSLVDSEGSRRGLAE